MKRRPAVGRLVHTALYEEAVRERQYARFIKLHAA
jgi:hypothetical protein